MFGFKPKTMKFNPLGVSIEFYSYKGKGIRKSIKKIITYMAGPISNFIIAIICYYINIDIALKTKLVYTNILIGIFNLIPIIPLDGGKIFKEILKNLVGNKNANIFMSVSTKIVLIILSVAYSIMIFKVKNISIFMLIIYLWYLYYLENKKLNLMLRAYSIIEKENEKCDCQENEKIKIE